MAIRFDGKDVARCFFHASQSTEHVKVYGFKKQAGLLLVHDRGVYLMSTGLPGDKADKDDPCFVAYAEGCDPVKDENEWMVNARHLVGGDDFTEMIPLSEFIDPVVRGLSSGRYDLQFEMDEDSFTMNVVRRSTPCETQ